MPARPSAAGSAVLAGLAALSLAFPARAADGDAEAGAKVFRSRCGACHVAEEPTNRVGPHLVGVPGRDIAAVEDFSYSDAMRSFSDGNGAWTDELLACYLAAPKALVPGTNMQFAGLRRPEDIANLIAYLRSLQ